MNLKTYRGIKNELLPWKVDLLSNNLLNSSITEDLTKNLTATQPELPAKWWGFFLFKADTVFSIYLNLIAIDKKYDAIYNLLSHSPDCWTTKAIFIDGEGAIYCSFEKLKQPQITMEHTYSIRPDISSNFSTTNSDQTSS